MSELKPCPFCGCKPKIKQERSYISGIFYSISHNPYCSVEIICLGDTEKEVADKWNRRAET